MHLSATDVAFLDICVQVTLDKKKITDIPDIEGDYDEQVAFAKTQIGRHTITDADGRRLSTLVIEEYVFVTSSHVCNTIHCVIARMLLLVTNPVPLLYDNCVAGKVWPL